jgi:N-acetyltransferase
MADPSINSVLTPSPERDPGAFHNTWYRGTPAYKEAFLNSRRDQTESGEDDPVQNTKGGLLRSTSGTRNRGRPSMIQTHIDLGQSTIKICEHCGMQFDQTQAPDRKAHDLFHLETTSDLSIPIGKGTDGYKEVWNNAGADDAYERIMLIDGSHHGKEWKMIAEGVLKRMDADLGGERHTIDLALIWRDDDKPPAKLFILIRNNRAVSAGLFESITSGQAFVKYQIEEDEFGPWPSIVAEYEEVEVRRKATMGVAKIWTSENHRREGYATLVVDTARHYFAGGIIVPKEDIAYTSPTDDGKAFICEYHDEDSDSLSNEDSTPLYYGL